MTTTIDLQEVKQLLWGHNTLPEIAERYHNVPFRHLYDTVKKVGSRHIRQADRYWLAYVEGSSVEEIAQQFERDPKVVVEALIDRGYEPVEEKDFKGNKFRLSKRLADAWRALDRPLVYLRQLMDEEVAAVAKGKVIRRTPPASEPVEEMVIPLNEVDRQKLEFLSLHSGTEWYPGGTSSAIQLKVLRTLLEDLISNLPELKEFGVKSTDAVYVPVNKLSQEPVRTTFYTPLYAHRLMAIYKQKRGASCQMNLSDKFRLAFSRYESLEFQDRMAVIAGLDRPVFFTTPIWFNHHYAPDGKKYIFNKSVSLSLFPSHKMLITEAEQKGFSHQEFLTAFFFWAEGLDQRKLKGWDEWVNFSQQRWPAGSDPHAILDVLEENGFTCLQKA